MYLNKCVRIIDRFLRHKFEYRFDEDRKAFVFDLGLGGEIGVMGIVIGVQNGCVNCLATFPFRGSDKTACKLAEFVCRVNSHLSVGHLDYDFDDGEVRFAYDLTEEQLKAEKGDAIERFLGCLYAIGKKFGPSIAQLSLGLGDPDALYKAAQFGTPDEEKGMTRGTAPEGKSPEDVSVRHMERCCEKATESKESTRDQKKDRDDVEDQIPVPVRNYSLDGLHVEGDFPIAKVEVAAQKFLSILKDGADALPDRPGFNILLWGPPGTGKSEFVNYLGQKLGRKVVVKMGSDVLSRYVGDTEKSIREAFDEAEEENAILFLDELDGVMQNRAGASAGWEVSQVNEILHQMEHFKGIMIGATNFRDNLDPAVLRRFTYKLEFGYLEPCGKSIFFDRAFKTPLTEAEKIRLDSIPNLTPGDFRTVSQSLFYLDDTADNATRLAALEKESAMKGGGHKVCLGFASH